MCNIIWLQHMHVYLLELGTCVTWSLMHHPASSRGWNQTHPSKGKLLFLFISRKQNSFSMKWRARGLHFKYWTDQGRVLQIHSKNLQVLLMLIEESWAHLGAQRHSGSQPANVGERNVVSDCLRCGRRTWENVPWHFPGWLLVEWLQGVHIFEATEHRICWAG